jgi:hypothetical protein
MDETSEFSMETGGNALKVFLWEGWFMRILDTHMSFSRYSGIPFVFTFRRIAKLRALKSSCLM